MNRIHPIYKSFFVVVISLAFLSMNSIRKKFISREYNVCENVTVTEYVEDFNENLNFENISTDLYIRNNTRTLFILGLFDMSTKWGRRKEGDLEKMAAQLAVEQINNIKTTEDYRLELLINDTMCDPGIGMDRLFHALYSKYSIFVLIGAGCSNVTERLAQIVPHWNIIQISYGSSSPYLSDRNKFPLFFRTATSDSSHNKAKIQFVKKFDWKMVAMFTENEHDFLLPVNGLIADLEKADILCGASITFSMENYKEQLGILKNLNVRIIFGSFSMEVTSKILCAAQNMGMLDKYVWIIHERENSKWKLSECQLERDVTGIITVSDFNDNINNCLPLQIDDVNYYEKLETLRKYSSPYPKYSYDAVWAIFHALRGFPVDEWFDYEGDSYRFKSTVLENLIKKMNSLTFFGISGSVRFNKGDRIANSLIRQIQDGKLRTVAIFDSIKEKLNFNCTSCTNIIWKNNEIPIARRILKISKKKIPDIIFAGIVLFSTLGISASMTILYFNLKFKSRRYVKLSSPNLTNVTVLGCVLVYSSVIVLGLNNSSVNLNSYFDAFCSIRVYLLSSGFSLTFGSIMAKTYRVHRLFTFLKNGTVRDKLLKDQQLIALLFIPLLLDGFILGSWLTVDPLRKKIYNLTLVISFLEKGVDYQPQVEICDCHNTIGWYVAMLGYKTMFILMGIYMAWKTRHIKVAVLNDSQYIGICMYTTVFSICIIVILNMISNNNIILTHIIQSVIILIVTTIIMYFMFLPIIKSVYGKRDSADPIMLSMGLTNVSNTRRFVFNDSREILNRLEIQNKVHRKRLTKLDEEILQLENLLKL
ncbi:gamma-aminobutyric acid type B receptor subunit 2 isoform X1 [Diorhabda carinulata]|uniref:gamma-aminobutyric acid type B receptor subunit 2 isoform X1 n=1 Tax=Diorhabda carinulata TaxID=1163345 RepID=UPI0025A10799|nr:gamma-aminobutyric acid type B receptor subunit 2 isoform X1 [Diorhabda carinulata]